MFKTVVSVLIGGAVVAAELPVESLVAVPQPAPLETNHKQEHDNERAPEGPLGWGGLAGNTAITTHSFPMEFSRDGNRFISPNRS
jgi:hypothetical protein